MARPSCFRSTFYNLHRGWWLRKSSWWIFRVCTSRQFGRCTWFLNIGGGWSHRRKFTCWTASNFGSRWAVIVIIIICCRTLLLPRRLLAVEGPAKDKVSPHIDLDGFPAREMSMWWNSFSARIPLIGVAGAVSEPMKEISLIPRGRCLTPDLSKAGSE